MLSKVILLPPTIVKQEIKKSEYGTLPEYLRPLVANFDHIWKVTVTPLKTPESGLCRVNIIAAANLRTGSVILENTGRVPKEAPPADKDDLRPIVHYAWGKGTQTFRVMQFTNSGYYVESKATFE